MHRIAISGGIGSGKSVVSQMLRVMGHFVYDCDSRAKQLMTDMPDMRESIMTSVSSEAYRSDGSLDRARLASIVFSDNEALARLNAIVHAAVRRDFNRWAEASRANVVWVESAIIYASGLDREVDEVWEVYAPEYLRIERVMRRSGLTEQQVRDRIEAQNVAIANPHKRIFTIVNDGVQPLLPQILSLLSVSR